MVNRISGVRNSVLALIAVDRGFESRSGQTTDLYKISIYQISTQHLRERAKTGQLGIRKMCPNGATCLPADCCGVVCWTGGVYLIQQYVIKFVSDLRHVGGFLRFPLPIKPTAPR